jgi:hypothetical protein
MAKSKERPTTSTTTKAAAARSPAAKPVQAQRPGKTAPDAPASRPPDASRTGAPRLSAEEVYRLIQESAYFKAKARGFAPGHEVRDWIEAEAEVRLRLEGRAA